MIYRQHVKEERGIVNGMRNGIWNVLISTPNGQLCDHAHFMDTPTINMLTATQMICDLALYSSKVKDWGCVWTIQ